MSALRKPAATDFLQVLLEHLINERGCANLMMFPVFPVHSCMPHDSKQSSQANLFMPITSGSRSKFHLPLKAAS